MKLRITVEGVRYDVDVEVLDGSTSTPSSAPSTAAGAAPPAPSGGESGGGEVTSPISGAVLSVRVKAGDAVKVNDTLLVLEAMKMESNIASTQTGTIQEVCVNEGDQVSHGQVLVRFA